MYDFVLDKQDSPSKDNSAGQEACELLKVGFEYVTEIDSVKVFRKRK